MCSLCPTDEEVVSFQLTTRQREIAKQKCYMSPTFILSLLLFAMPVLIIALDYSRAAPATEASRIRLPTSTTIRPIIAERTTSKVKEGFPRWPDGKGIKLEPLLSYIDEVLNTTNVKFEDFSSVPQVRFDPHFFYVVDQKSKLFVSNGIISKYPKQRDKDRLKRFHPAEKLLFLALDTLGQKPNETKWQPLREKIKGGGLPLLVHTGDFCDEFIHNDHVIPILTACAAVNSKHAFPMGNYFSFRWSLRYSKEWKRTMTMFDETYSWESKIAKAVWRGSPTGLLDKNNENQRWRLCKFGRNHSDTMDFRFGKCTASVCYA